MDAQAVEGLLAVVVLLLGGGAIALGVVLLVRGRRRGPDGGRGSAMLTFGITALVIGAFVLVPALVMLLVPPAN
ncbi:hypothetical protein LG314_01650 [Agrococcus terreus]|uniref:hypothetical protein n=1 Tax=Agrococcus terreus TaxID=574649 RepID=UPI0038504907